MKIVKSLLVVTTALGLAVPVMAQTTAPTSKTKTSQVKPAHEKDAKLVKEEKTKTQHKKVEVAPTKTPVKKAK